MAERKDQMALLSKFDKHYQFKYDARPNLNRWAEAWAADAIIDSYGLQTCYEMLDYYFEVHPAPSWKNFAGSMSNLIDAKARIDSDSKERIERRRKAKEWLSE
jgi:hypothetical protein